MNMMKNGILSNIKVGILGGGVSSEREISLVSAKNVLEALKRNGLNVIFIDIFTSQKEEVKRLISSYDIDLIFICLHGRFGEDGEIQRILEEMDIPYTGSSPLASFRAMDKAIAKRIFLKESIPTASFFVWEQSESGKGLDSLARNIKYPLVVKPCSGGSSLGVSIVQEQVYLKKALIEATSFQNKVVLEDYIEGRELTIGILEDRALAVVEIIPLKGHFDYHAKYTDGAAQLIAPANLKKSIYEKVQKVALRAHFALGLRHFSRVDMLLGKDNIPYVLEVNSIPGLTSHSLLPLSAEVCGIDFDELILKMVALALNEKKERQKV